MGIDLRRIRSLMVRTTEGGEVLKSVRIVNDIQRLASVMARAGEDECARIHRKCDAGDVPDLIAGQKQNGIADVLRLHQRHWP